MLRTKKKLNNCMVEYLFNVAIGLLNEDKKQECVGTIERASFYIKAKIEGKYNPSFFAVAKDSFIGWEEYIQQVNECNSTNPVSNALNQAVSAWKDGGYDAARFYAEQVIYLLKTPLKVAVPSYRMNFSFKTLPISVKRIFSFKYITGFMLICLFLACKIFNDSIIKKSNKAVPIAVEKSLKQSSDLEIYLGKGVRDVR